MTGDRVPCRAWLAHGLYVAVLYESGGLREVPRINPHHAFLQYVQVKTDASNVIAATFGAAHVRLWSL